MRFEFATAGRIVFEAGALRDAGDIVEGLGERPLVATGGTPGRAEPLFALLRERGIEAITFAAAGEPDVETIRGGTALARSERCDCVVGFGGGAVLDAAKAIAVMLTNPGDIFDYLEIVGRGRTLTEAPVPVMAVPTTAGTGSEVARNSVIVSPEHRVKASLRSPLMLPKIALVDPELTYGLPPGLTATTGLDALTQLIEPFVGKRANPMTDGLCQDGITRVARSLRAAVTTAREAAAHEAAAIHEAAAADEAAPHEAALTHEAAGAREDMAVASLFGGLALANAGLGAVHGIAGPLGGMIPAPHGALCAALLPAVVAANLRVLRERDPGSATLTRYRRVAQLLTGDAEAAADDAVDWLQRLVADLDIPRLGAHGVGPEHVAELVEKAAAASSMKANPIELTRDELASIVSSAL